MELVRYCVYFFHNPNSFREGNDDFLVVLDVLVRKFSTLTIFEPFLRGLVATDVEIPYGFRHIVEVLFRIDINPATFMCRLIHRIRTRFGIRDFVRVYFLGFEQMNLA